jgi:gluconokinase
LNTERYIITVDIGTTSTKTSAINTVGNIIAHDAVAYPILSTQPDFAEQDPEVILNAVKSTIKAVVEKAGDDILGVSFSSAMHSLILLDKHNQLLTNSIIWADNRSKLEAEQLRNSQEGFDIYLKTGTPIHPMSPLCKIEWIKKNDRKKFDKASKFISIKEYIFFRLFGQFVIDYSIASATGLFNIYDLNWNKPSLTLLGIKEEQLSKPVPVTFQTKGLSQQLSSELKLPTDTPFVIGGSDGCLANLGANSTKKGAAAVTIGTSGAIRMASTHSEPDQKQRVFNYLLEENTFIIGGPTNNGAILLDWFRDSFMKDELKDHDQTEFYKLIENEVSKIQPGAEGLIFLPYLMGERAPIWDASAKGVFFGISMKHKQIHFLRAMMEGIIFAIYSVGKTMEELVGEIEVINAGGGFAKSHFWVQMLADVFGKKVVINNSLESSSLGAAMVGFKSLGIYEDIEHLQRAIEIVTEFNPDPENHIKYKKAFQIFEMLYSNIKETFRML